MAPVEQRLQFHAFALAIPNTTMLKSNFVSCISFKQAKAVLRATAIPVSFYILASRYSVRFEFFVYMELFMVVPENQLDQNKPRCRGNAVGIISKDRA